jgi:hypothetical protein
MIFGKLKNVPVELIPIEVDPDLSEQLPEKSSRGVVCELESNMTSKITEDVQKLIGSIQLSEIKIGDTENDILKQIENPENDFVLLSPRVWGKTPTRLQRNKKVRLVRFRISGKSWPLVAHALSIPFN